MELLVEIFKIKAPDCMTDFKNYFSEKDVKRAIIKYESQPFLTTKRKLILIN